MNINVNESLLVLVKVTTEQGRTTKHDRKDPVCLTCEPDVEGNLRPYGQACQGEDHRRRQDDLVSTVDAAPEEASAMRKLTGEAYRAFNFGFSVGRQVFLIDGKRKDDVETTLNDLHNKFDEANKSYKVCRIRFAPMVIEIKPGQAHEATMASIRGEIDTAIQKLLGAMESGDATEIRDAAANTKNLAGLLDGAAAEQVGALNTSASKLAKELRKAVDKTDEVADSARDASRREATRFRGIFNDLFGSGDTPAEPQPETAPETPEVAQQS